MKKLFGIVVLGLLWSNVGFAEDIMLSCEPSNKKDKPISVVLNDKEKKVIYNGFKITVKYNSLLYGDKKISFVQNSVIYSANIDRITGILEEVWIKPFKTKFFKCKKVNKTAF